MRKLSIFEKAPEKPIVYMQKQQGFEDNQSFYHVTLHFPSTNILASGSDRSKRIATNKACCEAVERLFYHRHQGTDVMKFRELNSTTCMAAGFDLRKTIQRSNNECVERYIKLLINQKKFTPKKSQIAKSDYRYLAGCFDRIERFTVQVSFLDYNGISQVRWFTLCLCWQKGRFVTGSSVNNSAEMATEHSLVEAKRNLTILNKLDSPPYNQFKNSFYSKVKKMSKSGVKALNYLENINIEKDQVMLPKIYWQEYSNFLGTHVCRSFLQGYLLDLPNQKDLF